MANKLLLTFNKDNFGDFVSKLKDLTNIEDIIKIKINKDNILMYSTLSNDVSVLALKSYLLKTSDYINDFNSEDNFDYVIISATKIVKNLSFLNTNIPVKLEIIYKDEGVVMHVRSGQFSNGKLKISCIGAEQFKIRDITSTALESRLNPENSIWRFSVNRQDFSDIKKLASINSEDRIMEISINNKRVTMSENSKWEIEIDNVDYEDVGITFIKKYLSNINDSKEDIIFDVFETFILVKDENSNLMLSFETSF